MRLLRLIKIFFVSYRYGLDELVLSSIPHPIARGLLRVLSFGRSGLKAPRGERLRLALESLGPIFVKFGQVLSTRRDLMPPDIAQELARVPHRRPRLARQAKDEVPVDHEPEIVAILREGSRTLNRRALLDVLENLRIA